MCMAMGLSWVTRFKKIAKRNRLRKLRIFRHKKLSYKKDNSPKEYSGRKEHFKIGV